MNVRPCKNLRNKTPFCNINACLFKTNTLSLSNLTRERDMGNSSRSLASKPSSSASSKQIRPFIMFLIILLFLSLLFLTLSLKPNPKLTTTPKLLHMENKNPLAAHHVWFDIVAKAFKSRRKMKIGTVNMMDEELHGLPNTETVKVGFDRMTDGRMRSWKEYFPEWIDEDKKWRTPKCPEIPLVRRLEDYGDVDVVVARVPCGNGTEKEGIRDVFRLQVNLVVAKVAVESGWVTSDRRREMYVVFVGDCGPMLELFRCDDLVLQRGEFWVYKPDVARLKHKLLMPVGACQIAPPFSQTGKEPWRYYMSQSTPQKHDNVTHRQRPRYAYVTVLHSSEAYVCGAISLARSIRLTNSTKDLLLLADESITSNTTRALQLAGWKIRRIQRIRSPFSQKGSYNEWNYSKLRVWQLTDYEKVIFIDADLLVLKNIDHFFTYPQLSASSNNKVLFNSGLMVVEPSACLFEDLMRKSFRLESYNGGDQGFLNQAFTWWHKLPSKLNYLKNFNSGKHDDVRDDVYAMHYLGFKPWMCYRDYDCNWDRLDHHVFASDSANQRWWKVYDTIPMELKPYCGLTRRMSWRIKNRRQRAMNHNLSDGHWRIHIKDPRQLHYVD